MPDYEPALYNLGKVHFKMQFKIFFSAKFVQNKFDSINHILGKFVEIVSLAYSRGQLYTLSRVTAFNFLVNKHSIFVEQGSFRCCSGGEFEFQCNQGVEPN